MVRPMVRVVLFAAGHDAEGKPLHLVYEVDRATLELEHTRDYGYGVASGVFDVDDLGRPHLHASYRREARMTVDLSVKGSLIGGALFEETATIPDHLTMPRVHRLALYAGSAEGWTCLFPGCTWRGNPDLPLQVAESQHDREAYGVG